MQLRSVGAHDIVFAGEQIIDELAHAAKMDPVAFRIQNVVQGNDWARGAASRPVARVSERGHEGRRLATEGVRLEPLGREHRHAAAESRGRTHTTRSAMAQTATIADIEVNKKTGKVTVKHVYQAVSAGLAVYPDGIANQIVGGTVMGVSWTLAEQLRFSRTNVASSDFVTYPILRFKDTPKVTPIVIQWGATGTPYTAGVGEATSVAASRRDRQRVLRRDGRADADGADDAGSCPRSAQGGRRGVGETAPPKRDWARQRALSLPVSALGLSCRNAGGIRPKEPLAQHPARL